MNRKLFVITLVPALFMTAVCSTYVLISHQALALNPALAYTLGIVATLIVGSVFALWYKKHINTKKQ